MTQPVKAPGKLFIISSPSGGGKSSIIRRVLNSLTGISLATSHTSRPPRQDEMRGVHYHFVTPERFVAMKERGEFVEWVRLHGNYYGTSRAELEKHTKRGRDIILDIDVKGAAKVVKLFPEAASVFILPPSLTVLEERLRKRGSESDEDVAVRLREAEREIRTAGRYRYCIVNRTLARAVRELEAIVLAERRKLDKRSLSRLLDGILAPD
jgi:guanylate kinase